MQGIEAPLEHTLRNVANVLNRAAAFPMRRESPHNERTFPPQRRKFQPHERTSKGASFVTLGARCKSCGRLSPHDGQFLLFRYPHPSVFLEPSERFQINARQAARAESNAHRKILEWGKKQQNAVVPTFKSSTRGPFGVPNARRAITNPRITPPAASDAPRRLPLFALGFAECFVCFASGQPRTPKVDCDKG